MVSSSGVLLTGELGGVEAINGRDLLKVCKNAAFRTLVINVLRRQTGVNVDRLKSAGRRPISFQPDTLEKRGLPKRCRKRDGGLLSAVAILPKKGLE